jgi:biotin carboxylase
MDEQHSHALAHRRVVLLIPSITYRAADFLAAARRLGVDLVIASDGALPLGTHPVIHVAPDDLPTGVERIVRMGGHLDAVVAVDTPMLALAAAIAERIGVPHHPIAAVQAAMDKTMQRQRWEAAGIPQPAFRLLAAAADERTIKDAAADVGFPCVVKAVSLSGSRGVLRVDDPITAANAVRQIRRILEEARRPDTEPLLIEAYVPGQEISIDALLTDDAATVLAVFEKPDMADGPTFEETILISPPRLSTETLAASIATAERAARAIGLRHGPIHVELRIDTRQGEPQPTMLEVAARSIGGLCARALRFADERSLEELVLLNALGYPITPQRAVGTAGVFMLPVARPGILRAINGREEAARVPGITGISVTIPIGQRVRPLPEGDRYLGFLFAAGETAADVEIALRTAYQRLQIVITEDGWEPAR